MSPAPTGGHRLGRRGLCLLFFGGLDLIYAISLAQPDAETRRGSFFSWLADIAPLWSWSLLWFATALIVVIFAFQAKDRVGFTCAIFLKVLWGLVCVGGWLVGGVDRGYVSAAIWLAASGLVWVLSGWPEPIGKETVWNRPSS